MSEQQPEIQVGDTVQIVSHDGFNGEQGVIDVMRHVEPCAFCDIEQLFGSRDRRDHHERAARTLSTLARVG